MIFSVTFLKKDVQCCQDNAEQQFSLAILWDRPDMVGNLIFQIKDSARKQFFKQALKKNQFQFVELFLNNFDISELFIDGIEILYEEVRFITSNKNN